MGAVVGLEQFLGLGVQSLGRAVALLVALLNLVLGGAQILELTKLSELA